MAGEVVLQCQIGKPVMAVASERQVTYLLALVRPGERLRSLRFPFNFALVLDRSFSMRGANLQAVKEAVGLLVDELTPAGALSVVSFKGKAEVIVPAQPVTDKAAIKAAVEGMRAWGATKLSEGLRGGLPELSKHMRPDVVSRMILLTDGHTSGDEAECCMPADQARAWGAGIYPLGLGANLRMARNVTEVLDDQTRGELEQLMAGQVSTEQAAMLMKGITTRTRWMTERMEEAKVGEQVTGQPRQPSKRPKG